MDVGQAMQQFLTGNQTLAFWALVGVNLILGVIVALKDGRFTLAELGDISKKILPYGAAFFGAGLTGAMLQDWFGQTLQWGGVVIGSSVFAVGAVKNLEALTGLRVTKLFGKWLTPAPKPG